MKTTKTNKMAQLIFSSLIIITCVQLCISYTPSAIETDITYDISVSEIGNITSIQEAIDIAQKNDIIFIKNGIYHENIVIDKSITLIGENKTQTIIDGRNAGNTIKINAGNVTIKQITIQHSGIYFPNAGINISNSHSIIENTILKNNFYGMTLFNAQHNSIQNNMIQDNDHCGIYMSYSSNNYFSNNTITNQTYNGFGLYDGSNYNIISNNTLTKNGYCAVNIRISSMNTIIGNNISNNNIGIHLPSTENNIKQNTFSNNNKNYDEEILTPGFELILVILSVYFIVLYNRLNQGKH